MIIKFLGTSATWPLPHKKCDCQICSSKDKHDKRSRSAILVYENKDTVPILLDCGPDIVKQLRKHNIKKIKAVVMSHHHSDHASGLRKLNFKELNSGLIPVYASKNAHVYFAKNYTKAVFIKKNIKSKEKVSLDKIKILPLEIKHPGIKPTFALKLFSGSKTLIYMPDYKLIPKNILRHFQNLDLLVVGGAILRRNIPWHASIDQTITTFKNFKIKKIYFTHIGHLTLPYKELIKYVKCNGGNNFNVSFDGRVITI